MIRRFGHVLRALLIVLDIIACFLWLAPLYLMGLASRPTGRQLISAYTGRAAINGNAWALRLEKIIDALLGKGHCRATSLNLKGVAD